MSTSPYPLVAGAIFVTEAWTVAAEHGEGQRLARSREGISKHPDRTEAVMWNAIKGDRQLLAFAAIERPGNILGPAQDHRPSSRNVLGQVRPG